MNSNLLFEGFIVHNEGKRNGFYTIFNMETAFKHIYK